MRKQGTRQIPAKRISDIDIRPGYTQIEYQSENKPSNETIFSQPSLWREANGRGGGGRRIFSKSGVLYPSRRGALLPVRHRRAGRAYTVFRNDKRKRERAARCHGLSGRSVSCTGTTVPRGLFLAQRVCRRHGSIGGRRATPQTIAPKACNSLRKCSSDDKSAVDSTVLRRLQRSRVLLTRRHPATCGLRYGDTIKPHISLFANLRRFAWPG